LLSWPLPSAGAGSWGVLAWSICRRSRRPVLTSAPGGCCSCCPGLDPREPSLDYSCPRVETVFERGLSDCSNDTSAGPDGRTSGKQCEGGERPTGKAITWRADRAPGPCQTDEGLAWKLCSTAV
jgi:hypothetical protein